MAQPWWTDVVEIEVILDENFGGGIDTDRECFEHIEVD